MRMIDADALSRIVKLAWETSDSEDFEKSVFIAIATDPTIEERKKGKWIRGDAEKLTGSQRCSICHKACYKGNDYFNYCPNCGARMER